MDDKIYWYISAVYMHLYTLFPGCMCILWCSYLIFRVVTSLFLQFFIYPGHTLSHSYLAGFLTLVF